MKAKRFPDKGMAKYIFFFEDDGKYKKLSEFRVKERMVLHHLGLF